MGNVSRVPNQNGVSLLNIMFEIHHSGQDPSIWTYVISYIRPSGKLAGQPSHVVETLTLNILCKLDWNLYNIIMSLTMQ